MAHQENRNVFAQLKKYGFKINWRLLHLGHCEEDDMPLLFSHKDIDEYATDLLAKMDAGYHLVVQLLWEKDPFLWKDLLGALAKSEDADTNLQARKLIVYLADEYVKTLPFDCGEDGLYEMYYFWLKLDRPTVSPLVIRARQSIPSPSDYFRFSLRDAQRLYDDLVAEQASWIHEEIAQINQIESTP